MFYFLLGVLVASATAAPALNTCTDATYQVTNTWSFPTGKLAANQNCTITLNFNAQYLAEITSSGINFGSADQVKIYDSFGNIIPFYYNYSTNFVVPPAKVKLFLHTESNQLEFSFNVKLNTFKPAGLFTFKRGVLSGKPPLIMNLSSLSENCVYSITAGSGTRVVLSSIEEGVDQLENIFVYDADTLIGTLQNFDSPPFTPSNHDNLRLFVAKVPTGKAFVVANDYDNVKWLSSYGLYFASQPSVPAVIGLYGNFGPYAATILNDGGPGAGINLKEVDFYTSNSGPVTLNSGGIIVNPQKSSYFLAQYTAQDAASKLPRNFYGSAWTFSLTQGSGAVQWARV